VEQILQVNCSVGNDFSFREIGCIIDLAFLYYLEALMERRSVGIVAMKTLILSHVVVID
jgi:hypothetical protein